MRVISPAPHVEIEAVIAHLHSTTGLSILMVEQYVEFALRLADSYVVLDAGAAVTAGKTAALDETEVRRLLAVVSLASAAVPAPWSTCLPPMVTFPATRGTRVRRRTPRPGGG